MSDATAAKNAANTKVATTAKDAAATKDADEKWCQNFVTFDSPINGKIQQKITKKLLVPT